MSTATVSTSLTGPRLWAQQTGAMLVDAYRELNSKKLFWITLALNLLVVAMFGSLGINAKGVSFLHWTFDSPMMNARVVSPEVFYKFQFVTWAIPIWLSWVVIILGLVSTAGIVPDLLSGGTIETMLPRPLSRTRLLLTKFATGLLFMTVQVGVFSLAAFLVIGIRGSAWSPELLLAVPIVVLVYSYLYSVCVLLGLLTRSTVAALLLTMLVWFMIFLVNMADGIMLSQRAGAELRVEDIERLEPRQVEVADKLLAQQEKNGQSFNDADGNPITGLEARREAVNPALARLRQDLPERRESLETWREWSDRAVLVKTILPKTQETIGLLPRYLISIEDILKIQGGEALAPEEMPEDMPAMMDSRVPIRVEEAKRNRTVAWVLGTSIAFEVVVLGIACWIFRRRDF